MGRPKGSRNASHKRIVSHGYIHLFEPNHPLAMKNGYVREHRKVLYDAGIKVRPNQEVHHRNGIKADNRLVNLQVLTKPQHTSITWKGKKRRPWTRAERVAKSKAMLGNNNWKGVYAT